jgi:hypothetical protein
MRKLVITILVCTFVFGMEGPAKAALYTETFLGSATDGTRVSGDSIHSYTFVFDLTANGTNANYYLNNWGIKVAPTTDASGFNPSKYSLTGATLSYTFSDYDNPKDSAVLKTGSTDGSLSIANYTNSNRLDLKNGHTSQSFIYTFTNADLQYLKDGKLSITFSTPDSIRLDTLSLGVTANPVPVPAATWLLGTGLVGMFAIRRRTRLA